MCRHCNKRTKKYLGYVPVVGDMAPPTERSNLLRVARSRTTARNRWTEAVGLPARVGVSQSPQAWDILNHIGKGSSLLAIPFWCSYTVLKTKSRGKPSPLWEDESHERLIHTAGKTALTICGFHVGL